MIKLTTPVLDGSTETRIDPLQKKYLLDQKIIIYKGDHFEVIKPNEFYDFIKNHKTT